MDPINLEAPPGFEPGMEVLQTSALPLGDGAPLTDHDPAEAGHYVLRLYVWKISGPDGPDNSVRRGEGGGSLKVKVKIRKYKVGAGNGIRTRDFDLGKVALYH